MKKLIILLLPILGFAQEKVYKYNEFGVKDELPSIIIERDSILNETKIYNYNSFGVKNEMPSYKIETEKDTTKNIINYPDLKWVKEEKDGNK